MRWSTIAGVWMLSIAFVFAFVFGVRAWALDEAHRLKPGPANLKLAEPGTEVFAASNVVSHSPPSFLVNPSPTFDSIRFHGWDVFVRVGPDWRPYAIGLPLDGGIRVDCAAGRAGLFGTDAGVELRCVAGRP